MLNNYLRFLLRILLRDLLLLLLLLLLRIFEPLLDLLPCLRSLRLLRLLLCTWRSSSLVGILRFLERAVSQMLLLLRESLFIKSEDTRRILYVGSEGIR